LPSSGQAMALNIVLCVFALTTNQQSNTGRNAS
jgi:hypothetical protein